MNPLSLEISLNAIVELLNVEKKMLDQYLFKFDHVKGCFHLPYPSCKFS